MRFLTLALEIFIIGFVLFACNEKTAENTAAVPNESFLRPQIAEQATPNGTSSTSGNLVQEGKSKAPAPRTATGNNFDKPLLDHPNKLSIEFTDSVSERDKRLAQMAVDAARPLFENAGLPLGVEIHIAGDRESYIRLAQTLFDMSRERAVKDFSANRGKTQAYHARVLINIPIHYENYTGYQRDATLVFTIAHELYHVFQAKISKGWSLFTNSGDWFRESSANLAAWRAIFVGFCKPLDELGVAISSFAQASECPDAFVEKGISNYTKDIFLTESTALSLVEFYLTEKFGVDAYDRFYKALFEVSAAAKADNATPEQLWLAALEKAFGASTLDALMNDSAIYLKEHMQDMTDRLNERPGSESPD